MPIPLVSILIDTYNHEPFIEQAIVSVLEQDVALAEMEIILVDDGSTDNTPAIVRKFAPRVRYLGKANGGQASAFNAGIPETRGEIVAFLDGDDWWAKDKLSAVLNRLVNRPEIGAVGHGFYEVFSASDQQRVVVPDRDYEAHLGSVAGARLFSQLRCFMGTSRFTARRTVLERILPVPEDLVVEADEYLFTLAPAIAPTLVLSQPLFYYRLHENNQFMIQSIDPFRLRRKQTSLATLVRTLPGALARLGAPPDVVATVLEHTWVDAERMSLMLDGGKPWRTFAVERASFALDYSSVSRGYRLFKWFVLGLTLVTPPRRFYGLRRWYSDLGLRRIRKVLGEPRSPAPIFETAMESRDRV